MPKIRKEAVLKLLACAAVLVLGWCTTQRDWLALASVDVKGNSSLTKADVIEAAGLDNPGGIWAIAVPRYAIQRWLESNSLIESAQVSLTGPTSLEIQIRERQPVAAVEYKEHRLVFDRTGELMNIIGPSQTYTGRIVKSALPGLLKVHRIPISCFSTAWNLHGLPDQLTATETLLNRTILLLDYVSANSQGLGREFEYASMDESGHLAAQFSQFPPILLGRLTDADQQFKYMTTIMQDPKDTDPRQVSSIDLSNVLFPCIRKNLGGGPHAVAIQQAAAAIDGGKPQGPAKAANAASTNPTHPPALISTYQGDLNFFSLSSASGKGAKKNK